VMAQQWTGSRKDVRAITKWERRNKDAYVEQARNLAMSLCHRTPVAVRPYALGLALLPGESVWAEAWARCSLDRLPTTPDPSQLPLSLWLATNCRIVGRLASGALVGWGWGDVVAYRTDLQSGIEWLQIDLRDNAPVVLYGPGVAPLAVAVVAHVHGIFALLEHPGLAPLRVQPMMVGAAVRGGGWQAEQPPRPALPPHRDDLDDLLRGL